MGAVLFIDVDAYLMTAARLTVDAEVTLSTKIRNGLLSAGKATDVQLIRSFGDGFLLILRGDIDHKMFDRAIRFLSLARTYLTDAGFTFKASLTAGPFVLQRGDGADGSGPFLVGPAGNYAGKLLGRAARGQLVIAWPETSAHISLSTTFDDLSSYVTPVALSIDKLPITPTSLSILSKRASTMTAVSNSPAEETIDFTNQVKIYIGEMIKLADDKAKFATTISGGLLAYLFNQRLPEIVGGELRSAPIELLGSAVLILTTSLLIAAFTSGALVLLPRMATAFPGMIFFGSVAKWPDAEKYWESLRGLAGRELARESAIHNYEYARVTVAKYVHLRRSMRFLYAGLCTLLVYFLLWDGLVKA